MKNFKRVLLLFAAYLFLTHCVSLNAAAEELPELVERVQSREGPFYSWMTDEDHNVFAQLLSPFGQISMLAQREQLAATKDWLEQAKRAHYDKIELTELVERVQSREGPFYSWMTDEDHNVFAQLLSPFGQISMLAQREQLAATKDWLEQAKRAHYDKIELTELVERVQSREGPFYSWMTDEDHNVFAQLLSPFGQISMLAQREQLAATKAWLEKGKRAHYDKIELTELVERVQSREGAFYSWMTDEDHAVLSELLSPFGQISMLAQREQLAATEQLYATKAWLEQREAMHKAQ